jgi:hypothetical protein
MSTAQLPSNGAKTPHEFTKDCFQPSQKNVMKKQLCTAGPDFHMNKINCLLPTLCHSAHPALGRSYPICMKIPETGTTLVMDELQSEGNCIISKPV